MTNKASSVLSNLEGLAASGKRLAIFAIGAPGVGKSTFYDLIDNHFLGLDGNHYVSLVSTDNFFDILSHMTGETYNKLFENKTLFPLAEKMMANDLSLAIEEEYHIFWDQTNMTKKSRASKIKKIPENYIKVALDFSEPPDLDSRLADRAAKNGKSIPEHVMSNMIASHEAPTLDEGFDYIFDVEMY